MKITISYLAPTRVLFYAADGVIHNFNKNTHHPSVVPPYLSNINPPRLVSELTLCLESVRIDYIEIFLRGRTSCSLDYDDKNNNKIW